ncbi:MAG: HAD family hydrolase [Bacteroidales bacterium]|nr:HAD family hydrolase [Bacteroidales bacterium]
MSGKLVIFDLDGTLLNTIGDLSAAVNHALGLRGLPMHGEDEYLKMVGYGVRRLVQDALPECHRGDEEYVDAVLHDFRKYYVSHIDCLTRPYGGMVELAGMLASEGFSLAVASNKFQRGAEILVERFFPDLEFVAVCGNSPELPLKPDPALVEHIMDLAGSSRESTVMVGDSGTDMLTAANAGIFAIGVSWGFRPAADLAAAGADAVVATPARLHEVILRHFGMKQ